MKSFWYQGRATIKHLNPRKEGPEDDKALALDVKLLGKAPASLWDFFHDGLRPVLYTDIGAAKNLMMESVGFTNEVRNCTVTILGREFPGVTVSKFKLKPVDTWQAEITMSITVQPTGTEVAEFAEYLQDEVEVTIAPERDLFSGDEGQAAMPGNAGHPARLDDDELLYEARRVVIESGRTGISFLQRQLGIGYTRAAQLLEQLERVGVLHAPDAQGMREIATHDSVGA